MGDKFLFYFFLLFIIATTLGHFRGVRVQEQAIVASDELAYALLDLGDCERIVEALG